MSVAATVNPDKYIMDPNGNRTCVMPDGRVAVEMPGGQWVVPLPGTQADYEEIDHPDSVYVAEMQKNIAAGEKYTATESKKFLWRGATDRVAIIRYDKKGGYLGCDRTTKLVARRVWKALLSKDWTWCGKGITLSEDALRYQPVNVRNAVDLLESKV